MSEMTKECPFCGSADISDGEMLTEKDDKTRVSQSQCRGCGAFGPEAITDGPDYGDVRAIAAWNRRTPQPVTPAGGEVEPVSDADRLDFMVHRGANIDCYYERHGGHTVYRVTAFGSILTDWHPSYRAAIDAALNQRGGG